MLDDGLNAGVLQVPRLGVFGWQTNYLMLGLPLMLALSPDQFRAVLAHEVGHLSRSHSRFSGWVYRVRRIWVQLLVSLEEARHGGLSLLVPFVRWYAPYFNAYTFVLARADEYVADRCAAEVCGAERTAQALIMAELRGHFFGEEFWSYLFEWGRDRPEPPPSLMAALGDAYVSGLSGRTAERRYEQALEERTGTDDTHPALRDRLAALGFRGAPGGPLDLPRPPLPLPAPEPSNSAEAYLGPMLPRFSASLEAAWRDQVAADWREAYQKAQAASNRLESLDRQAGREPLNLEEAWERVALTTQLHGETAAAPLLRDFVREYPNHAPANYLLGRTLLEQDDAQGVALLQRAASADPQTKPPSYTAIAEFLRRHGQPAEAARYLHLARQSQPDASRAGTARP